MMKVLITEQDIVLQQRLQALCKQLDYSATILNTVESALQIAREETFDLIYTAHYLPDATGFELTRELRKDSLNQSTPIILITKDNHQALIEKAFAVGVTDTFSPEQFEELEVFLSRIGENKHPMQGHVLLVEDSLAQQRTAIACLKSIGLTTDTATEVDSAWQLFNEKHYDLVITDIVLEGDSSGLSLVQQIRRIKGGRGDTPIIVMSGYDDPARRIELFHLGVDEYVTKPVVYEELLARVRHMIRNAQLQAQLLQQKELIEQQHTALSQFIGRMSHECRNSINIISGVSRLLIRKPEQLSPRQLEQIQTISHTADHQLSLVNDILDYSKLQAKELSVELTPCDIKQLLTRTAELFSHTCDDKQLTLSYKLDNDLETTLLDERKTQQILINLVGNAVKFTESGSITLSAYSPAPARLEFCVEDTGPGIAEADKDRLFHAFSQTQLGKSAAQGTGLGLAICADFARLMGGEMRVESNLGSGSRFICQLPLQSA